MVWPKLDELKPNVEQKVDGVSTPQQTQQTKEEFVFEEARNNGKVVFTIWGRKGDAKTSTALGFPGTLACLSFDGKTNIIKKTMFNDDDRIRVYDALKYDERGLEKRLDSAVRTKEYLAFLLDNISKNPPDFILIDGVETFTRIMENVMRKKSNLGPISGVPTNNWKMRKALVDSFHLRCFNIAKKGVIYTTYPNDSTRNEIVQEGTVITRKELPKYTDLIIEQTDVVIRVTNDYDSKSSSSSIKLRCDSSKYPSIIRTGTAIDITGKKVSDV